MTTSQFRYDYDVGRRVEVLSTWYLRFHGYLTTPHFILHRPDGTQYTEADILGVRFPLSIEDVVTGGPDPEAAILDDVLDVVIGECSADAAKINMPWKEDFERHLQYVLRYIGRWPPQELATISEKLRQAPDLQYGWHDTLGQKCRFRFLLFARSPRCESQLQPVKKIRLLDMLTYFSGRFRCYSTPELFVRSRHSQWDPFIRDVYDRLMPARDVVPQPIEQILDWILGRTQAQQGEGAE